MFTRLVDKTLALLRAELPRASLEVITSDRFQSVDLPFAPGAEYRLSLCFYNDGDREITGIRVNAERRDMTVRPYFWYHPFEHWDYDESQEKLAAMYDDELRRLLHVPTRVRQRRRWCMGSFVLECETVPGTWDRVYGCGIVGLGNVDRTPSRERVFFAPPISQALTGAPGA